MFTLVHKYDLIDLYIEPPNTRRSIEVLGKGLLAKAIKLKQLFHKE